MKSSGGVPFYQKYSKKMSRYVRFRRCGTCLALFPSIQHLQEHVAVHKDQVPYLCCVCGTNWANEVTLRYHRKEHGLAKNHTCMVCDSPPGIADMFNGNGQLRKYQCGTCGEQFKFKELYEQHSLNHGRSSPLYTCIRCKISFTQWDVFADHFGRAHLHATKSLRYTPSYTCSLCKNKSSGVSSLTTHFFLMHKTRDVTMCYDCLSGFSCRQCYRDHENIHREVYVWVGNVDQYLPEESCTHPETPSDETDAVPDDKGADSVGSSSGDVSLSPFVTSRTSATPKKVDKCYPPEMYWPRDVSLTGRPSPKSQQRRRTKRVDFDIPMPQFTSDQMKKIRIPLKDTHSGLRNFNQTSSLLQPHNDHNHLIPRIVVQPQAYDSPQFITAFTPPHAGLPPPVLPVSGQTLPLTVQSDPVIDPSKKFLVVQTDAGTLLFPVTPGESLNPVVNNESLVPVVDTNIAHPPAVPYDSLVERNILVEKKFLDLLTVLLGSELVDSLELSTDNLPYQLQKFLRLSNINTNGDNSEDIILKFLYNVVCTDVTFQDVISGRSLNQLIEDMLRVSQNWKVLELPSVW